MGMESRNESEGGFSVDPRDRVLRHRDGCGVGNSSDTDIRTWDGLSPTGARPTIHPAAARANL